jgi:glycosyltransferase involved in cell wall biosynthesis
VTRRLMQAIAGARHGGAELFFVRLAAALRRAGEVQRVLIRRDSQRAAALRAAGIAVGEYAFAGRFDLATRLGFRREVARWRPDIVLTWMSRATAACPAGDFVHVARLGGYYDLKHYRCCDYLIGNTRAIADYAVAGGWPRERVVYLPNFVPEPAGDTVARARSGVLALGRLHPNKGFELLLEAIAETRGIELQIAGDGPLRSSLERLATRLGVADRVRFLGWRDDASELLRSAALLVCPSLREPLGNVVIEAWAASAPVVATASDGPAALIENEKSGLLAPLPGQPGGGPAALARAIERVLGDAQLAESLARGGREAYRCEFTEEVVVDRYRQFFDRIVARCAA